jgi:hypothetical protein
MSARMSGAAALDASAIGLSGLCLIHCLALPFLAAFLPVAGLWAEAEWVHKAFVVAALPISGFVILRAWRRRADKIFVGLAGMGLVLLSLGAFAEPLHDNETQLTITGALTLAGGHFWRWHRDSPHR